MIFEMCLMVLWSENMWFYRIADVLDDVADLGFLDQINGCGHESLPGEGWKLFWCAWSHEPTGVLDTTGSWTWVS